MVANWDRDALRAEVLEPPRRAFVPLPDLQLIERPGWVQLVTPSFRTGGFNEVAHAVLDAGDADAVIDATIAQYRALGIQFRWWVGPDSAPADLGARLERRGLVPSCSLAMARATQPPLPGVPAVTVERVDARSVDAYTRTMAAGWEMDPEPLAIVHALVLREASAHRLYLARIGGEPVGVAAQVLFARSAYQLGAVVLPAFRGRGAYAALVAARLADAHAAGLTLATTRARADTSAPLLARWGFEAVCELQSYRYA